MKRNLSSWLSFGRTALLSLCGVAFSVTALIPERVRAEQLESALSRGVARYEKARNEGVSRGPQSIVEGLGYVSKVDQKYLLERLQGGALPELKILAKDSLRFEIEGRWHVLDVVESEPYLYRLDGRDFRYDPKLSLERNVARIETLLASPPVGAWSWLVPEARAVGMGVMIGGALVFALLGGLIGANWQKKKAAKRLAAEEEESYRGGGSHASPPPGYETEIERLERQNDWLRRRQKDAERLEQLRKENEELRR